MSKYIQGKDGKMAGSIGDGKDSVPTPNLTPSMPAADGGPDTASTIDEIHDRYLASRVEPIVLDDQGRREVIAALNNISEAAATLAASWGRTMERLQEIHDEGTANLARINLKYAHLDVEEALRAEDNRGSKYAFLHERYYEKYPEPQNVDDLKAQLADIRVRQAEAGLLDEE